MTTDVHLPPTPLILSRSRAIQAITALVLGSALVTAYAGIFAPRFAYLGYTRDEIDLLEGVTAVVALIWTGYTMPKRVDSPGRFALALVTYLVVIPTIALLPIAADQSWGRVALETVAVVVAMWLAVAVLELGRRYRLGIRGFPLSPGNFALMAVGVAVVLAMAIVVTNGSTVDPGRAFQDLYDVRATYKSAGGPLLSTATSWLQYAIVPAVVAVALIGRRWRLPLIAGAVFTGVLLFAVSGNRSAILMLIAAALISSAYRRRFAGLKAGTLLGWPLCGLVIVLSLVDVIVGGASAAASLLVRRLMIVPGLNSARFFEVFTETPPVWLSHSILGGFVNSPVGGLSPVQVVGFEAVPGQVLTNPNGNLFADGFANFGFIGVILVGIILGFVCWLMDSVHSEGDSTVRDGVIVTVLATWSLTLVNSALLTALITHGFIVALILALLSPNGERRREVALSRRGVVSL